MSNAKRILISRRDRRTVPAWRQKTVTGIGVPSMNSRRSNRAFQARFSLFRTKGRNLWVGRVGAPSGAPFSLGFDGNANPARPAHHLKLAFQRAGSLNLRRLA